MNQQEGATVVFRAAMTKGDNSSGSVQTFGWAALFRLRFLQVPWITIDQIEHLLDGIQKQRSRR